MQLKRLRIAGGAKQSPLAMRKTKKLLLAMKLTAIILLSACVTASAKGFTQITLTETNASLQKVFKEIKKQTGYSFLYKYEVVEKAGTVTVRLNNVTIEKAVEEVLKNTNLTYTIIDKTVVIKEKASPNETSSTDHSPLTNLPPPIDVKGRIVNENGEPVLASVQIKNTSKGTTTNADGYFELKGVDDNATLVISGVSIESFEVKVNGRSELALNAKVRVENLNEVVINKGYYSVRQRENTGNVSKVTSEVILRQPVSNLLAALEGRVSGLTIKQESGLPGANFVVQIRGQNSLAQGNFPLYIIDGVPFSALRVGPFGTLNQLSQYGISNQSPLNNISPTDIESVEVLKDADATAIYGSRGANGVILITTKRGKLGKTKTDINLNTGYGKVSKTMPLLNTQQYLKVRHEAFNNDGVIPDLNNAPDLYSWDTTRYTDWQKYLIGGTAKTTDVEASISGGEVTTQFILAGNYHREETVFPGTSADNRAGGHLNVTHSSATKKFFVTISANFTYDKNQLPIIDLTKSIDLPPNAPPVYDSLGKLNWANNTWPSGNPLKFLFQKYQSETDNLTTSSVLRYEIFQGLQLKTNLGYSNIQMNQIAVYPKSSQDPASNPSSTSIFGNSSVKTWILEPQLEYITKIGKGRINALLGTTFQNDVIRSEAITARNFSSDALLETLSSAGNVIINSYNYTQYRYNALYGRINYNWEDKYFINLTGRRDGSSRFGPGKQFANFGAVGANWIFSEEKFIKNEFSFLSSGKLRASYGTTGNDQIGDYQYLNSFGPTQYPYQSIPGLYPLRLYNPNYSWEINKKFETTLEMGFWKNAVLLSITYYQNTSSSQLVKQPLPGQTGFVSIQSNLNAVIKNTGWEFEVTSNNIKTKNFEWRNSLNLTIPRNKLVDFPGLSSSSYSLSYVIGKPLSIQQKFHFVGVNSQTGIYQFEDAGARTATSNPSYPKDLQALKKIGPDFYGGFENCLKYKDIQLDIFFQFVKQTGYNYKYFVYSSPGMINNFPTKILDRWQMPGDVTKTQMFTQDFGSSAFNAWNNSQSFGDNVISDASFIRLKNLSLSYNLPSNWTKKIKIENCRIYLQGQNVFTITNYLGLDPESQNFYVLPPLRVVRVGLQLTL